MISSSHVWSFMTCIYSAHYSYLLSPLWPNDVIWHGRHLSNLVKLMVWWNEGTRPSPRLVLTFHLTPKNELWWNRCQYTTICIDEHPFENGICNISAILLRSQYVKQSAWCVHMEMYQRYLFSERVILNLQQCGSNFNWWTTIYISTMEKIPF